ncbi:T3SS effector HopA1 family protein [Microcoleus sp. F4-D5]|uniref:T3SS effector HopA1 family protein n=1 Tax=Microcoleus sp. F4-D5 TaxID=2818760 RepID=UPI002FD0E115
MQFPPTLQETLHDIASNIQIESSEFRISHSHYPAIETPAATVAQLQKMPQASQDKYLNSQLLEFIHSIYFEGSRIREVSPGIKTNEQILQEIDSREIDWEFYEQLDRNNHGKGFFHPGHRIVKQEADGSLAAEFDGVVLHIQRARHLPVALQSAAVNDPVAVLLPSSYINGDRYRANGDGIGGLPPLKFHSDGIVVYFNFTPEAAVWSMNYLTTKLNEVQVPFAFEVLHNPLNYSLYDSGLLKFPYNPDESYRYKEILLPVLQAIYAENKSHFRDRVPIFTKVLAPGIGLAEHPASELKFGSQQKFGENRCEIVANALLAAHQNNDESKQARMKYIIQNFERLGLDIERPYLNPNSEDIYTPLD